MRRGLIVLLVVLVGLLGLASTALAQGPTPTVTPAAANVTQVEILGWYGRGDWLTGLVFFIAGIFGALVTAYLFAGEFLPSMGGYTVEYRKYEETLKAYQERLDQLTELRMKLAEEPAVPGQPRLDPTYLNEVFDDIRQRTLDLEKYLRSERWRLYLIGAPMYLVLGGFFAAALARNPLEAILVGFAWVAAAQNIGLRREEAERREIRETQTARKDEKIKDLSGQNEQLKGVATELANQLSANAGQFKQLKEAAAEMANLLSTNAETMQKAGEQIRAYETALDLLLNAPGMLTLRTLLAEDETGRPTVNHKRIEQLSLEELKQLQELYKTLETARRLRPGGGQ